MYEKLLKVVKPYYARNDSSHAMDHVHVVLSTARAMNEKLRLDIDDDEIVAACLMHDMFLYSGRENHHIDGAFFVRWVITPELDALSKVARERVAYAIAEHRGSYKGNYYSRLSELLSSADRADPSDLEALLKRARNSQERLLPGDLGGETGAINHLKHKYGTNGYAKYPWIYRSFYGQEAIEELQRKVDEL